MTEINFKELESEKFWSFPKTYKGNKKDEARNMIFSTDYIGAEKIDGAYYRFVKEMDGKMVLQGRSRSVNGEFLDKIGHVPHLMDFFNSLPNGTCLLGEIYLPSKPGSHNTTTIMGCLEDKAIKRQEDGEKVHYYIFDMWQYDGISLMETSAEERFTKDLDFIRNNENPYVEVAEYLQGAPLWEKLQKVLIDGGEGIVITKTDSIPAPGKKTARKTLKIKKELEERIDAFFTGKFTPATRPYSGKFIHTWQFWENIKTGEKITGNLYEEYKSGATIEPVTRPYFHGWAGSLEIGLLKGNKIIPIGLLSGLEDKIKGDPLSYKHRVIEVSCMEIFPETMGLRHAVFEQFRDDLTVKDCTWEKVFGE